MKRTILRSAAVLGTVGFAKASYLLLVAITHQVLLRQVKKSTSM